MQSISVKNKYSFSNIRKIYKLRDKMLFTQRKIKIKLKEYNNALM